MRLGGLIEGGVTECVCAGWEGGLVHSVAGWAEAACLFVSFDHHHVPARALLRRMPAHACFNMSNAAGVLK